MVFVSKYCAGCFWEHIQMLQPKFLILILAVSTSQHWFSSVAIWLVGRWGPGTKPPSKCRVPRSRLDQAEHLCKAPRGVQLERKQKWKLEKGWKLTGIRDKEEQWSAADVLGHDSRSFDRSRRRCELAQGVLDCENCNGVWSQRWSRGKREGRG